MEGEYRIVSKFSIPGGKKYGREALLIPENEFNRLPGYLFLSIERDGELEKIGTLLKTVDDTVYCSHTIQKLFPTDVYPGTLRVLYSSQNGEQEYYVDLSQNSMLPPEVPLVFLRTEDGILYKKPWIHKTSREQMHFISSKAFGENKM